MSNETPRERLMVIVAHPDDAEFGSAGTVARWAREGARVTYVICTDGSKGSKDPAMTPERMRATRQAEQRAAADVLGVADVVFLGYEDGVLEPTLALRKDLTRAVRRYRPDTVIIQPPTLSWKTSVYVNHPDHQAAARAALAAVYPSSSDPWIFPDLRAEGLAPHQARELLITSSDQPNYWVDITETIELKVQALLKHASQLIDWDPSETVRARARTTGEEQGMEYAETFQRVVFD